MHIRYPCALCCGQRSILREKLSAMGCVDLKPVFLIMVINLIAATSNILLKVILSQGMNLLVIVTYRQAAAAIFLVPVAFFSERKKEAKVTPVVLCYIFVSALLGGFLSQYLSLLGLHYTTAEFASAFVNATPTSTFVLALVLRQENVSLKSKGGRAKVLGSLICIAGVMLLTLYKGIPLNRSRKSIFDGDNYSMAAEPKRWLLGSLILTCCVLSWSSWFVIQTGISKRYPCKYTSTAIWSSFSSAQAGIACIAFDRDVTNWVLKGKLQICVVLFSGIAVSGLCYAGMAWCVEQRGPVFTAAFTPFMQIFTGLFDLAFLHEQLYMGSVLGSVLVISGLYTLLWGKNKDAEIRKTLKSAECNGSGVCKSGYTTEVDSNSG